MGWPHVDGVTYVPRVTDVSVLPHDEYDEWYILDSVRRLGPLTTFVNYLGFGPSDPEKRMGAPDVGWDLVGRKYYVEREDERQNEFWGQLERIQPESCIVNGDLFVFVTTNKALFDAVERKLNRDRGQ
jgi:hypothetical protein